MSVIPTMRPEPGPRRVFYSVADAARLFGLSEMTLYRAIAAGQFPAVRIRGRLIVPARAIDEMVTGALAGGAVVDAAAWVPEPAGAAKPGAGPVVRVAGPGGAS